MADESPPDPHRGNGKNGKLKHNDPARANHLKPYKFKKGNPGGPGARGQVNYFKKAYADLLQTEIPMEASASAAAAKVAIEKMILRGARIIDFVALAQILRAMNGDTRAAAEIADRVDGRALQQMRIETEVGDSKEVTADLSKLTADEIETLIGLYRKAALEPLSNSP